MAFSSLGTNPKYPIYYFTLSGVVEGTLVISWEPLLEKETLEQSCGPYSGETTP